jgi:hypothetical protein
MADGKRAVLLLLFALLAFAGVGAIALLCFLAAMADCGLLALLRIEAMLLARLRLTHC